LKPIRQLIRQLIALPQPEPTEPAPPPGPDTLTRESIRAIDIGIVAERMSFLDAVIGVLQEFRLSRLPGGDFAPFVRDVDDALLSMFRARARLIDMQKGLREEP
jgi:hypothetical protein